MRLDRRDFKQLTGHLYGEPNPDWSVEYIGHKMGMHFEQRKNIKHAAFVYWDAERRSKIHASAFPAGFNLSAWLLKHHEIELVVTETPIAALKGQIAQFIVPDTWLFYLEVATYIRQRYQGRVIAVTGSVGKTTTRLMVDQLVRATGRTAVTNFGNDNVRQVLPQLLTSMLSVPDALVAELSIGTLHPAELDGHRNPPMSHYFQATTAIITQIGGAHQRSVRTGRDDLESSLRQDLATAKTKGRIFERMRPDGHAILNYDMHPQVYKYLWKTAQRSVNDIYTFSLHDAHADAYLVDRQDFRDYSELKLKILDETVMIQMTIPGNGPVMDLLAACLAVKVQGWALPDLTAAFKTFKPLRNELVFHDLKTNQGGLTLVEDTYNSTRHSVLNVLSVFRERGRFYQGPKVLVIETGDDLLAQQAERLNLSYQQPILDSGVDVVFGYRDPTITPLITALTGKVDQATYFPKMADLATAIEALPKDALVIIKGQHFKYGSDLRKLTPLLLKQAEMLEV
ncbi:Mur ligase family protein [Lactiplantibacillus carotarum]|uniref:Mur ligase family protein n=1 Tax=Lactiplantibacillus carotarum TaxID=2993456 RepID=UPI00298F0373|nr:Mur ligase family protein [Lactiplantibacillus carotarum]